MLYFLGQFGDQVSALNVFRYITFRTAGATMTAIVFVFLFGPAIIAALRVRQGKGQPIREDGPQNHLITKKGTPTMGGLMILSGIVVTTLLWANLASPYVWVVLFVTIGFGCIGLYDDYLKVSKASANNGFSGRLRLSLEAAIAIVACIALAYIGSPQLSTALTFPFLKEAVINLGWFFVPVGAFVIVGAGNAVNLTDGLDGLAIVPVMIAAASFALIAYLSGNIVFAEYLQIHYVPGTGELAIICGAVLGAGLGFLWFNAPPAAIFMGDTGSLALGGLLGAVAVASKHEVVLAIVGGLFVLEAMSVIIQVTSFKLTGKRIFKMAPIHHHFEALGWTEAQVVIRFWIVAVLLALVGLSSLKIKMIPVTTFAGRSVAVFGLGGSGIASALALAEGGAEVSAWDDNAESVATARAAGVSVADLRIADWQSFAALVLSPGVPLTHPKPAWPVVSARAAGIEIIGDIELFCRERRAHVPDAPFVAVTGTNGKSTTTALIAHLLSVTGREVELGGNIGKAILSLEPPRTGRYHVIECSSFQIDLAPTINPTVGVLLNVTPDHLNRHGTLPAYARIKERLVAGSDTAVIAVDDGWTQSIADRIQRHGTRVIRVSSRHPVADGIYASGSDIIAVDAAASHVIDRLAGINTLRGEHNAQNAAAAIAAVRTLGLNDAEIQRGLQLFAGLPHRLEEVGRRGNVTFINDSKATNADATSKALAALSRIYWIAGGRQKEGGIAGLAPFFPRIMKAYLIGEAANEFSATLGDDVPYMMCGTLQAAVAAAASDAADDAAHDPVVLLSPACASYDQFQNFERRGDAFRALVLQLNGITAQGEAA